MKKTIGLVLSMVLIPAPALAQLPLASPPAEPDAIPLYGRATTGAVSSEIWEGWPRDAVVRNVTRPTLTPVRPAKPATGAPGVIVAPGGAFMALSMEKEGWAVAKALADKGFVAFVLKYRLIETPADPRESGLFMARKMREVLVDRTKPPTLLNADATADAFAALAMVRRDARRWGVDPNRVGMIGFSAGAMTALNAALDAVPARRPAFIGYIYGPQTAVAVPADAPAMFDAIALDDPIFAGVGFPIVDAWRTAKRPVELHAYQKGGHGFGAGDRARPLPCWSTSSQRG